ncbi:transcription factor bHLH52 [Ricinus communis]|uniref:DNA binding protein, putative n=1 Tax=Ricinus communis TaxID=3988 RepID=B9T6A4_RICCO|nr:transcription factor bHLH52 [Ricinus communis]XP_048229225.1 transcription factor bHLH52 [Ricinus communis]EEF28618.1 DNA binding protein, putative [Ricinus communis]|eukprot:XP_002533773.1 transcription factor bHLH52 [Ricinus communis]
MALSFCPSFEYQQQGYLPLYPQTETDMAAELLGWHDDNFSTFSDCFVDPLFGFDEMFYSDTYTSLLPYFSSPSDDLISLSPEIFPLQEVESYQYPKREKIYSDDCQSNFVPAFSDGYVASSVPVPDFTPEIPASLPKFETPLSSFSVGRSESSCVKKPNGGSLSAQSIAARERRRKITERTQELGKLIPGGNKMNTAEMLQSASNYVKFLQAQVGILELMESTQERKEDLHRNELQVLLVSSAIQEKLYSQEKCLVPREFLETMANDHEIQSTPFIIDEIDRLLGINS